MSTTRMTPAQRDAFGLVRMHEDLGMVREVAAGLGPGESLDVIEALVDLVVHACRVPLPPGVSPRSWAEACLGYGPGGEAGRDL